MEAEMVRMFVRHTVRDYKLWRKAYNSFDKERKTMGAKRHAVYRSAVKPNDITVSHDFQDLRVAKAFAKSRRLRAAMKAAGVKGAPTIWFVKEA
jgi:hypothetical protein